MSTACRFLADIDLVSQPVLQRGFRSFARQVAQLLSTTETDGLLAEFHITCTSETRIRERFLKGIAAFARDSIYGRVMRGFPSLRPT